MSGSGSADRRVEHDCQRCWSDSGSGKEVCRRIYAREAACLDSFRKNSSGIVLYRNAGVVAYTGLQSTAQHRRIRDKRARCLCHHRVVYRERHPRTGSVATALVALSTLYRGSFNDAGTVCAVGRTRTSRGYIVDTDRRLRWSDDQGAKGSTIRMQIRKVDRDIDVEPAHCLRIIDEYSYEEA